MHDTNPKKSHPFFITEFPGKNDHSAWQFCVSLRDLFFGKGLVSRDQPNVIGDQVRSLCLFESPGTFALFAPPQSVGNSGL